jgi:hypothetical protein
MVHTMKTVQFSFYNEGPLTHRIKAVRCAMGDRSLENMENSVTEWQK